MTTLPEDFLAAPRTPAPAPPHWLGRLATALHEELPTDTRDDWAARLHTLLGAGPDTGTLRAVHIWHADTVLPLLGEDPVFAALGALHRDAAQGATADQGAWRTALTPVLLHLYDAAYDRTSAYAEAHTGARDYALANGFSATEADTYGHEYAWLSSDANALACAEAHAEALGPALARAYASDGCEAYADTFPEAQLRAVARALGAGSVTRPAEGFLSALEACRP
ncbi:hypothetical protein [Streptomyces sp. NPDC010273]|uniref:hypothetical protein n=1 Tax=Streptomyces sp. NPDC010273 TaxID=3364829 RepID=UPI0036EF004B